MDYRLPGIRSRRFFVLATVLAASALACLTAAGATNGLVAGNSGTLPQLALSTNDRVLVLAPHPDDETLACGGVLQRAQAMGLPTRVVFLTYGDNNEWSFAVYRKHIVLAPAAVRNMGEVRHDEAVAATTRLGLSPAGLAFLGYPDFETLHIWTDHWGDRPPQESMLTRVTAVPYTNAFHAGAPYKGECILADLERILREFRPTRVFVSHPADFNPDHRSLYLFTRIALWDLAGEMTPTVHPYLVHFPRWPQPRHEDTAQPLTPPAALAGMADWATFPLPPASLTVKREAIRCHRSQIAYSPHYLGSFMRTNELFGDLPVLLLSRTVARPHEVAGTATEPETDAAAPGLLTDEERARFVGVEWRRLRADEKGLTLLIGLSRPLGEAVTASIQICGYRSDVPFARMPRLRVEVGTLDTRVSDNGHPVVADGGISVRRQPREIEVTIPWETLATPTRLLISARTYLGDIPLDWAAWRTIEITP